MRDLTQAIIPAIYEWEGRILIGVDDLTSLTPTQQAFWLAILEHAQVIGCASSRKSGLSKLWWKMKHVAVPPLDCRAATDLVRDYIARHGVLIESPGLYIGHVVKQANGNPQAIMDMLESSAREKRLDKRQIREMRHAAGLTYVDFTPVMFIAGAAIIGTRYLAIGLGDTALYVMAGMGAALFLSLRVFMFKGSRGRPADERWNPCRLRVRAVFGRRGVVRVPAGSHRLGAGSHGLAAAGYRPANFEGRARGL